MEFDRGVVLESDWKLYKQRLPEWQERYIAKVLEDYKAIIDSDGDPSTKFWALDERIKGDKRCPGVIVYRYSRSTMNQEIASMASDGVIALDDLEGFSDQLIECAKYYHIAEGSWSSAVADAASLSS